MTHLILAPLRGFTDAVFRSAFNRHFAGVDEAVAPFVTSIRGRRIKASHLVDLSPAENQGMPVVPQILSNDSEEFVCLSNTLVDLGYREINWNLGCPFPMVAKKMRGSGLLDHPQEIDRLLDHILNRFKGRLSIKTRLGRNSADEMATLIPIFNRYPLARVMVHPRTGIQMYTGGVDLAAFRQCLENIRHPIVYNGDINDLESFGMMAGRFAPVSAWMLGRGLIANPFLGERIKGYTSSTDDRSRRFVAFHDDLVTGYGQRFAGPGHVLDRMKGFWRYFSTRFSDERQVLKKIRKTSSLQQYRRIVTELIDDADIWG